MGISDEDYAKALEKHYQEHLVAKMRLAQEKERARQEKEQMLASPNITWTSPQTQTSIGIKPLREEDLKHDAMKAPLSALVDMWTMRWDTQWVNEQEFMDDDFWRLALLRLLGAGKLEKHNLVNQYHAVYRIIE
jgi:hypothetical protein